MRQNINKVSERGERLDSLQDKTDNLAVSAQGFRRGANRVRKQMWWKDMKMRVCLVILVIVLLIVIIVPSGKTSCNTLRNQRRGMLTQKFVHSCGHQASLSSAMQAMSGFVVGSCEGNGSDSLLYIDFTALSHDGRAYARLSLSITQPLMLSAHRPSIGEGVHRPFFLHS